MVRIKNFPEKSTTANCKVTTASWKVSAYKISQATLNPTPKQNSSRKFPRQFQEALISPISSSDSKTLISALSLVSANYPTREAKAALEIAMAMVRIRRSKRKQSRARSLGQGNQWRTYWHSRKPARRSSVSLQMIDDEKPVAEVDGCCRPSTPSSSSASISLVSSPPEECPSYYPWPWGLGTAPAPTADLWSARSNYIAFLSEYMTSAAAALSSPPDSPHYTTKFPLSYAPGCRRPSAMSVDYTPVNAA